MAEEQAPAPKSVSLTFKDSDDKTVLCIMAYVTDEQYTEFEADKTASKLAKHIIAQTLYHLRVDKVAIPEIKAT